MAALLLALLLLAAGTAPGVAQETGPQPRDPIPADAVPVDPAVLVRRAVEALAGIPSFHAEGVLTTRMALGLAQDGPDEPPPLAVPVAVTYVAPNRLWTRLGANEQIRVGERLFRRGEDGAWVEEEPPAGDDAPGLGLLSRFLTDAWGPSGDELAWESGVLCQVVGWEVPPAREGEPPTRYRVWVALDDGLPRRWQVAYESRLFAYSADLSVGQYGASFDLPRQDQGPMSAPAES